MTALSPVASSRSTLLFTREHEMISPTSGWFRRHGHLCATRMVAEMPQAHVEVEQFINQHKPNVVVYDVPMPYGVAGICWT